LYEFIELNRDELIASVRERIAQTSGPAPTEDQLAGIPLFLTQLVARLRESEGAERGVSPSIADTAVARGRSYSPRPESMTTRIVHDYGAICQTLTQYAVDHGLQISPKHFQMMNRALDEAIAGAIAEYTARREESRDEQEIEDIGVLAHELRNSLSAAMMAFSLFKDGVVPLVGKTADVLERNLLRAQTLIDRSLAGIRLEKSGLTLSRCSLREILDDVMASAMLHAERRRIQVVLKLADLGEIVVDRHLMTSAISNLVQNAIKFTHERGVVTLSARSDATVAVISVEDECGGLPVGKDLFRPFVQGGADRSGLGLGLTIVQRTVRAHEGVIKVDDRPGVGCVFRIEIPAGGPTVHSPAV
jgi:signal transduction histidine kinase